MRETLGGGETMLMIRLALAVVATAITAAGAAQPADERIAAIESAIYPFVIVRDETLETTPLAERMRQLGIYLYPWRPLKGYR